MAIAREELQKTISEAIGKVEVHGQDINEKTLSREGTDDVDDFIQSVADDLGSKTFGETLAPDNFFPTRLDPQIYDNGTLFRRTPLLTYLEAKGRTFPSDTLDIKYLKQTAGFAGEWIDPANDTAGTGTPTIGTATASMCYVALPVSLSRIIGLGQSRASRPQIMNLAQIALREEINQTLVSGSSSGTEEFDGLNTIAVASGNRTNLSGAAMTVEKLDDLCAIQCNTLKSDCSFVLTNDFVMNQIRSDMYPGLRNIPVEVTAGINPISYSTPRGPVPFISDQNIPTTASQRTINLLDEENIFIENFIDMAWVQKGITKPFAEDGWLTQVLVMYNTYPGGITQGYGIA
jgi:hypothetical protein